MVVPFVRVLRFYRNDGGFSNSETFGFVLLRGAKQKRQGRPLPFSSFESSNQKPYLLRLTAFLSSAPAENFATLRAAILIVAPVCGLRPLRAFLAETEKVPKPINATRSPFFRAIVMLSTAVSIAVDACVL